MIERVTQAELAELSRVTPRTIRNWASKGLPRNRDGTYTLRAVLRWHVTRREGDHFYWARVRLAAVQADRLALSNAARRNQLCSPEIWREAVDEVFGEIRTVLRAMPARVAPQLTGNVNQRKEHLEVVVREILACLCTYGAAHR